MFEIDFAPLIDIAIQIAAAIVLVVGTWAAGRLVGWLGLKQDAEVRNYLNSALYMAIEYGRTRAREFGVKGKVETQNKTVAEAVNYLIAAVPDALDRFNVTDEHLADMVKARLEQLNAERAS